MKQSHDGCTGVPFLWMKTKEKDGRDCRIACVGVLFFDLPASDVTSFVFPFRVLLFVCFACHRVFIWSFVFLVFWFADALKRTTHASG